MINVMNLSGRERHKLLALSQAYEKLIKEQLADLLNGDANRTPLTSFGSTAMVEGLTPNDLILHESARWAQIAFCAANGLWHWGKVELHQTLATPFPPEPEAAPAVQS